MRKRITRVGFLILLGIFVIGGWVAVSPTLAQSCTINTSSCTADVTPRTVFNTTDNQITVFGQGFDNTSGDPIVILDGYGVLATTYINSSTLTAIVPAGIAARNYTVRVINDDGFY